MVPQLTPETAVWLVRIFADKNSEYIESVHEINMLISNLNILLL